MAQYWTQAGLDQLAIPESSGIPTAQNPNSSASGLYGFLTSTWNLFAPQAGVDIGQYPTAKSAPASVQTSVAAITPITNWICPTCDDTAVTLAQNPAYVTASPITAGANAAAASITPAATLSMPGYGADGQPIPQQAGTAADMGVDLGAATVTSGATSTASATNGGGGNGSSLYPNGNPNLQQSGMSNLPVPGPKGQGSPGSLVSGIESWLTKASIEIAIAAFALILLVAALWPQQVSSIVNRIKPV